MQATNASANVKSFITYVHDLPTGRESGQFVAMDLGGTNFREARKTCAIRQCCQFYLRNSLSDRINSPMVNTV